MVEADAGEDGGVGTAGEEDAALEETEPGCCEGAEDCWWEGERELVGVEWRRCEAFGACEGWRCKRCARWR